MKRMNLAKGLWLCHQYSKKNEAGKALIRRKRLEAIVTYAKVNSPYYRELYKDVTASFSLSELPCVNKVDLMAHFDQWITDPGVRLSDIEDFTKDPDNIGRRFGKKYLVFTTSGSTGNPLTVLCDPSANAIMGAVNTHRTFTRREDFIRFMKKGGRSMGVFATGGFYLANSSIRTRLLAMPWKKRQIAITSALLPLPQIVEELNAFQPAMLGGYPTVLELLADEQNKGRLSLKPVLVMTGGEYLSEELRRKLSEAFNCYVQTSYGCTEGGTLAFECTEHHFHVNDDWILIEPVDSHNKPVADGTRSDKILITNLFNYTQPFIRYEVSDRVVMHHEPCPCGHSSPWLTLEGRTDDMLSFREGDKVIKIPPLALYATLKEIHSIRRFQLVSHKGLRLELRQEVHEGVTREEAFHEACEKLKSFLSLHGVTPREIQLSSEEPRPHPKSGKFKHIIQL